MKEPKRQDPSQFINRGQLYQLIVRRLYAAQMLKPLGLLMKPYMLLGLADEMPNSLAVANYLNLPIAPMKLYT